MLRIVLIFTLVLSALAASSQKEASDKLLAKGYEKYVDRKYPEAIHYFSRAIDKYNKNSDLFYLRGMAYYYEDMEEEAIKDFDQAILLAPENPMLFYMRGRSRKNNGDRDGAIADYGQAVSLDSNYSSACIERGYLLIDAGKSDEALQFFNLAIRNSYSQPAEVFYARGICLTEAGQYKEAMRSFEQAIELKPLYIDAYMKCGMAAYKLRKIDQALEYYSRVIELDPGNTSIYSLRAEVWLMLKDLNAACIDWNKALQLGDESAGRKVLQYCSEH